MAGSDFNKLLAGLKVPVDECTTPIEFSTVTNCLPLELETSSSVRPRHGRIIPVLPVIRCERFGFVEI